jgi:AcrR family transcriptional regulator
MSETVKRQRRYDATHRRELARETRRRVLAAAQSLFVARGYAATTMADVAAEAGVAVQTVYSAVGGKAELLKQVLDVAVAGDDAPVPLVERPAIRRITAETDGRRKLQLYAAHLRRTVERIADLDHVLRAAADADPQALRLRDTYDAQRLMGMTMMAENFRALRLLRRGMSVAKAADVFWLHMDPRIYVALVRDRGWSARDYERWYVETTAALVLPPGA